MTDRIAAADALLDRLSDEDIMMCLLMADANYATTIMIRRDLRTLDRHKLENLLPTREE